jgi:hypothetical protein
MDTSTTITLEPPAPPAVRWEPCTEFHGVDVDGGVCAGCGWSTDDHSDDHELPAAA